MPVFSPPSLICVWRWHHSDFAVHFLSVSLTLAPNGRASGRCNLHCHSSPAAEMFRWRARRQYQISTPNSLCILLPSTGRSPGLTNACRLASPPFQSSPSSPTPSRYCHTAAPLPLRRRSGQDAASFVYSNAGISRCARLAAGASSPSSPSVSEHSI